MSTTNYGRPSRNPDVPLGRSLVPKQRGDKKRHADGETPPDTDIAGYPGIPGRW
jgi:hypothetical protein